MVGAPEAGTTSNAGKADGVTDTRPDLFYVRNDLAIGITLLLGDGSVYDAWDSGSNAPGVYVAPYGTSPLAVFGDDVVAMAVVDETGAPLHPDSLTGSIFLDEEGNLVMELVVGEVLSSEIEPLESSDGELDSPADKTDDAQPVGESYSDTVVGGSSETASAWGWSTNSDLRNQLKTEARNDAWFRVRRSRDFMVRTTACREAGGRELQVSEETCSYSPRILVPVVSTECRAKCTFEYRCVR